MEEGQKSLEEDSFPAPLVTLQRSISENDITTIRNKLSNFEDLDSAQKTITVQNLPIMLDQLGAEGLPILRTLAHKIMEERDVISVGLLYKVPEITAYCHKHEDFDANLKSMIIPIVIRFLNMEDLPIKEQAAKQLSTLAWKLGDRDRGEFILKHVLLMSHDDSNENNRLIAVQLLSSLSECLGAQLCEQFVGLEFLSMGDDTSQRVKKEAIKHLPVISKMVSNQFFQYRILPYYYEKAQDPKNWGLRKACADIILDIVERANDKEKQGDLTDVMLKLLNDTSKWVKISAYKSLGKFIYHLKGLTLNQKLFQKYVKMADNDVTSLGNENEIPYSCAFNLPAVASAVGAARWSELSYTYDRLLKIHDKRLKITLSEGLHEIAKIIGAEATEKYLFPTIDLFLKEESEDVKLGIIKNMAEIMQVLSVQKREQMVGVFEEFQKDQKKWRIRESIARQLPKLLQMYSSETILIYMVPILLNLCSDPVFVVRQQAAKFVIDFIEKLSSDHSLQQGVIESVKALGTSPSFNRRIQFIQICKGLVKDREFFEQHCVEILESLSDDRIVNVRLYLADFLREIGAEMLTPETEQSFPQLHGKIQALVGKLKSDSHQQIQQIFIS